jgi:hypothetical protein
MKKFLAVYLGSDSGSAQEKWEALDDATREKREEAGMTGWMQWAERNSKAIVDGGSPIGKTLLINAEGISKSKNQICAYTIVQAESHEAAAKLFLKHPHFMIFPGDSVEIMECLPIPGM